MSDLLTINLCNRDLDEQQLQSELLAFSNKIVHSLFAEDNQIKELDMFDIIIDHIIQVSFANNRLTDIHHINQFANLKVLNLSSNYLTKVNDVCQLVHLEWLCIKDNPLRNIDILNTCTKLTHLDASSNQLTKIPRLNQLKELKTLLLNRNFLMDLQLASCHLPHYIQHFSLEYNQIKDLEDVKQLNSFNQLLRLSLVNNRCTKQHNTSVTAYRRFVITHLPTITMLDELVVTPQERENTKHSSFDDSATSDGITLDESPKTLSSFSNHRLNKKEGDNSMRTLDKKSSTPHLKARQLLNDNKKLQMLSPVRSSSPELPLQKRSMRSEKKVAEKTELPAKLCSSINNMVRKLHSEEQQQQGNSEMENDSCKENDEVKLLLLSESEFIPGDGIPDRLLENNKEDDENANNNVFADDDEEEDDERHERRGEDSSGDRTIFHFDDHESFSHASTTTADTASKAQQEQATTPSSGYFSKYEQYEMRPIKPLNSKLQHELYGSSTSAANTTNAATPTAGPSSNSHHHQRPQMLKKHSGVTSKHDVTHHHHNNNKKSSSSAQKTSAASSSSSSQIRTPARRRTAQNLFGPNGSGGSSRTSQKSVKKPAWGGGAGDKARSDNLRRRKLQKPSTVMHPRSGRPCRHEVDDDSLAVKYPIGCAQYGHAAVVIQSAWRGYSARNKDIRVMKAKYEIRSQRSEMYISVLCDEVEGLKETLSNEKKLQRLQVMAMKQMWQQINELKNSAAVTPGTAAEKEGKETEVEKGDDVESNGSHGDDQKTEEVEIPEPSSAPTCKKDGDKSERHEQIQLLRDENRELRRTVDQLQLQMIQLQQTVLTLQDQLTTPTTTAKDGKTSVVAGKAETKRQQNHHKFSLREILNTIDRALSLEEIWSICHQTCITFRHRDQNNIASCHVSPETLLLDWRGAVSFVEVEAANPSRSQPDEPGASKPTAKETSTSGLSFTLWCLSENRKFESGGSDRFHQLLLDMSRDEEPISNQDVIERCEEQFRASTCSSQQVCAALFKLAHDKLPLPSVTNRGSLRAADNSTSAVADNTSHNGTVATESSTRLDESKNGSSTVDYAKDDSLEGSEFSMDNDKSARGGSLHQQQKDGEDTVDISFEEEILPPQHLSLEIVDKKQQQQELSSTTSTFSVILKWINPTHKLASSDCKPVGYRIYVNGQAKGMISPLKSRALLEGLKTSYRYTVHMTTLTSTSESQPSNAVIALKNKPVEVSGPVVNENGGSPASQKYWVERVIENTDEKPATVPSSDQPKKVPVTTKLQRAASATDSASSGKGKYDDIVARVLNRYGIPKSSSMTSSLTNTASSATTSPKNHNNKSSSSTTTDKLRTQSSSSFDVASTNTTVSSSADSSSSASITPRSKLLLEQLKDELMQRA